MEEFVKRCSISDSLARLRALTPTQRAAFKQRNRLYDCFGLDVVDDLIAILELEQAHGDSIVLDLDFTE